MKFICNEKLTIIGAAGMIGSNMAQTAIMMGLTPNICLYDPYLPGLEGVAEELCHCGFDNVRIHFTGDIQEALKGASYVLNSGGAPRKEGMTREDLLKGNAEIARQFGKDLKSYCPGAKHVVIIFNPADITGLVTLLYSGLRPKHLSTLAALDSTRLRCELSKYLKVPADSITNCRTYGGHGEQMAVFSSTVHVKDELLSKLIDRKSFPESDWKEMKQRVVQGGAQIIKLRGRSSFQSPAYVSVEMIAASMGGRVFNWPAGVYVNKGDFHHIMMAMDSVIDKDGVRYDIPKGTPDEMEELKKSYNHLCTLRDEVIKMGIIPKIADWGSLNPNLG